MVRRIKLLIELLMKASKKKGFKSKCRYLYYAWMAYKKGVIDFRLDRIASEYLDDYMADTGIPRKEKIWYYKRGIPTFKTQWCGLNKNNYKDYISDFDFYNKKNYMNTEFENWFEHKLNTYYLLAPFKEYMPKHYYFIRKGKVYPIDVPQKVLGSIEEILELVKIEKLAIKACIGGHGKGFYKLSYSGETYYANDTAMSRSECMEFIGKLDNCIITEYGMPHLTLQEICGKETFAVIRTVTVFDEKDGAQLTAVTIRLGTKAAGFVSDYDGTIYCGVSLEDGRLFNPIYRSGDSEGIMRSTSIVEHPDTGRKLEGVILPNFEQLVHLVKSVSAYLPITPYLVMDIIPTEDGFQILEINSHGQVRNVEPFYPFNLNPYNRKVFQLDKTRVL